jgi:hypothetical protein
MRQLVLYSNKEKVRQVKARNGQPSFCLSCVGPLCTNTKSSKLFSIFLACTVNMGKGKKSKAIPITGCGGL